jgi:hypothetical protein
VVLMLMTARRKASADAKHLLLPESSKAVKNASFRVCLLYIIIFIAVVFISCAVVDIVDLISSCAASETFFGLALCYITLFW